MTLSDHSEIVYKCSDFYSPENEGAILWNDSTLGIKWGNLGEPILNEKDFRDRGSRFIYLTGITKLLA